MSPDNDAPGGTHKSQVRLERSHVLRSGNRRSPFQSGVKSRLTAVVLGDEVVRACTSYEGLGGGRCGEPNVRSLERSDTGQLWEYLPTRPVRLVCDEREDFLTNLIETGRNFSRECSRYPLALIYTPFTSAASNPRNSHNGV